MRGISSRIDEARDTANGVARIIVGLLILITIGVWYSVLRPPYRIVSS